MNENILSGEVLDEQIEISLTELCQACSIQTEWVVELVEEGILQPISNSRDSRDSLQPWRFTAISLYKARTATRLQRDLGINIEGIALALDLLDEINQLKTRLARLEQD